MWSYLKNRAKERDTQTVAVAAAYTIARLFLPPQYQPLADLLAGSVGIGIAATPSSQPAR